MKNYRARDRCREEQAQVTDAGEFVFDRLFRGSHQE